MMNGPVPGGPYGGFGPSGYAGPATPLGSAYPSADAPPLMPRMAFPPQPMMDSAKDDGPISVAFNLQPSLQAVRPTRPCPDTRQYLNRWESWLLERPLAHPSISNDVAGYVQAAIEDLEGNHAASNENEYMKFGIRHNEYRLVYQSISGWVLNMWQSEEDFEEHQFGAYSKPRPIVWWDLRQAHDVDVEIVDVDNDICPNRIRVLMSRGALFFRVELPENVPVWYMAIKNIIMESSLAHVKACDSEVKQSKRWPAACGLAQAMASGWPIGERAMAIAFHVYDIDYDCALRLGEIVILLREIVAGMLHAEGRAEGADRDVAVASASSRIPEAELCDRALSLRRRLDPRGDGCVRKDEFVLLGHEAIMEALDLTHHRENGNGDSRCSIM